MKNYVILDKKYSIRGLIEDKETLKLFKEQRNADNFIIEKVKDEEIYRMMDDNQMIAVKFAGIVLFPDEYEYLCQSFDQMIIDIECFLKKLYEEIMKYLKLDDDENKILADFIFMILSHLKEYDKACEYGDLEIFPEELFFKLDKMARKIIS